MKCTNHPETDAVGVCQGCGISVCQQCKASLEGVLCDSCLASDNSGVMRQFMIELAISGGLFVLALSLVIGVEMPVTNKLMLCLMAAFLPFGWGALSRFFTTGSEFANPVTSIMALSMHLAGAAMLGILVGPPRIYKAIREIMKARQGNLR